MREYRRLLAAVDLTEDGVQVIERARDLAKRYDSELTLIHVVEPMPIDAAGEAIMPPVTGIETELYDNAQRRLKAFTERLQRGEIRRHIVIGYTKREILNFAAESQIDLIVVGSHGRHGLALLLGSTANAVLHGANCDVLAVRV